MGKGPQAFPFDLRLLPHRLFLLKVYVWIICSHLPLPVLLVVTMITKGTVIVDLKYGYLKLVLPMFKQIVMGIIKPLIKFANYTIIIFIKLEHYLWFQFLILIWKRLLAISFSVFSENFYESVTYDGLRNFI